MWFIVSKLPVKYGLVYSYLCFRRNINKETSRREVSSALGIDRARTLPTIVRRLQKLNLVADQRAGLLPLQPDDSIQKLFYYKDKKDERWWRNFSYVPIRLRSRSCPLNQTEHLLYFFLKSVRARQTFKGLGKLLGCSRWSIGNAVDGLAENNLLKVQKDTLGFTILEKKNCPVTWFDIEEKWINMEAVESVKESRKVILIEPEPYKGDPQKHWRNYWQTEPILEKILAEDPSNPWLQVVFPQTVMNILFEADERLSNVYNYSDWVFSPDWFRNLAIECRAIHNEKGKGTTSAYLFLHKLKNKLGVPE